VFSVEEARARADVMRLLMAQFALGRMALHCGCLVRGGNPAFHMTGIRRELKRILLPWRRVRATSRLRDE
jgi:hypothetical protein